MGNLQELLALAKSQQGYQEKTGTGNLDEFDTNAGYKDYTKYSRDVSNWGLAGCQGQPWCATYQFWLEAMTFGVAEALDHYHMTEDNYRGYNCFATYRAFEQAGRTSQEPQVGALIVFNYSHIGRVIAIKDGRVYTNEGNTSALYGDRNGGTVREKSYAIGDDNIKGYCIMKYCTGGQNTGTVQNSGSGQDSGSDTGIVDSGATSNTGKTERIRSYQKWLNLYYGELLERCLGEKLKEDGDYGPKTRNASLAVWKDVLNRKHGCSLMPGNPAFGEKCRSAAEYAVIRKGDSGTFTAIAEGILAADDFYKGAIDAKFGSLLEQAVKNFQKENGLETDGIVGPKTWGKMFG